MNAGGKGAAKTAQRRGDGERAGRGREGGSRPAAAGARGAPERAHGGLAIFTLRVSPAERAALTEMASEAKLARKRLGEYLHGLYRERRARAPEDSPAAGSDTRPGLAYADGLVVGRLAGELAAAFGWHLEEEIPLGPLRAWARKNPLLAGYLTQTVAEEAFGARFLRWWQTRVLDPAPDGHASGESA